MTKKIELNSFQIRCASRLMQALLEDGRLGFNVILQKGTKENWIELELSDAKTKLWIHLDGAEWSQDRDGKKWERSFEWQEFRSNLKDLIEAFVSHVIENIK